jgi:hypothetical protein
MTIAPTKREWVAPHLIHSAKCWRGWLAFIHMTYIENATALGCMSGTVGRSPVGRPAFWLTAGELMCLPSIGAVFYPQAHSRFLILEPLCDLIRTGRHPFREEDYGDETARERG